MKKIVVFKITLVLFGIILLIHTGSIVYSYRTYATPETMKTQKVINEIYSKILPDRKDTDDLLKMLNAGFSIEHALKNQAHGSVIALSTATLMLFISTYILHVLRKRIILFENEKRKTNK